MARAVAALRLLMAGAIALPLPFKAAPIDDAAPERHRGEVRAGSISVKNWIAAATIYKANVDVTIPYRNFVAQFMPPEALS